MTPEERKRRSIAQTKRMADPEVRKHTSDAMKKHCANPEILKQRSEAAKRTWAKPEVRKRRTVGQKRAFAKLGKAISERQKRTWANMTPEERQGRGKAIQRSLQRPGVLKRRGENIHLAWENLTPKQKARRGNKIRRTLAKPEVRERLRTSGKAAWTPERTADIKGMWATHLAKIKAAAKPAKHGGGRPHEDEKAEMIHELRTRTPQVKWDDVLTAVVNSWGHIGLSACKNLHSRWLKRTGRKFEENPNLKKLQN